jgi:small subunit ribosomal protein S2
MNIDKPYIKKEAHPFFVASSEINLQNTKNLQAYETLKQEIRPSIKVLRSEFIQDLLKTKGHLGTNNWTENMSKFLLGSRNGISIIDLEYTFICLRRVLQFLENMNRYYEVKIQGFEQSKSGFRFSSNFSSSPHILFVNTHTKYSELVKQTAIQSNQSYINERWIGGTLTNWKQISESILLYNKFSMQFDSFLKLNNIQIPIYQKAKKRYEGLNYSRNAKSLFSSSYIPDIIVLTNPDQNNIVIKEAQLFKIPIIAFGDTNTKTSGIDYIIPGNNKSIYFMYLCLNLITITLQRSKLHHEK